MFRNFSSKIICSLIVLLLITGCSTPPVVPDEPLVPQKHTSFFQPDEDGTYTTLAAHTNFLGGLTQEEMTADFDALIENMRQNYPYWGVVERLGIDAERVIAQFRADITVCENDLEFYNLLDEFFMAFDNAGHLSFLNLNRELIVYASTNSGAWNEDSEAFFDAFDEARYAASMIKYGAPPGDMNPQNNVSAELLTDEVGYVKIRHFVDDGSWDQLYDFYPQLDDCTDLIYDIRGNGGGNSSLFEKYMLLAFEQPPRSLSYMFFSSENQLVKSYADSKKFTALSPDAIEADFAPEVLADIERLGYDSVHLSSLPSVYSADGSSFFDLYSWHFADVDFNGRIWLLVDKGCYSTSEMLANYCKDTGWATLVGAQTGGDGVGVDPYVFQLPNSNALYRFSVFYGVGTEGHNSEEFGTTPDIICDSADALDRCLEEILSLKHTS